MTVEVIGVDHIFVSVGDLGRSEEFYDRVMAILGFHKGEGTISGDPNLFYYNRQFAYSLRPAREGAPRHDPYAPGLHRLVQRDRDGQGGDLRHRHVDEIHAHLVHFGGTRMSEHLDGERIRAVRRV
jgi:catechol 2,3-dioxygenase-like lactoylglutathione lyase family enzyme